MKLSKSLLFAAAVTVGTTDAFIQGQSFAAAAFSASSAAPYAPSLMATTDSASTTKDCGCETFSGDPSDRVRTDMNIRQAIRTKNFYKLSGDQTNMDEILGDGPSIVVFLRSLG